jgi:hypothetical protein
VCCALCCSQVNNLEYTQYHLRRQGVIVYQKKHKWLLKTQAGIEKSIAVLKAMIDQKASHEDCVAFANEIVTYYYDQKKAMTKMLPVLMEIGTK